MRADDSGKIWWNVVIGAAVGAIAGLVGQVASDVVTSIMNKQVTISNAQTYIGATVGGAAGGAVLGLTGSVHAANLATGFFTTGIGQVIEKNTIQNYDKSYGEILGNAVADGAISYGLGKIPGFNGLTRGRNSQNSIYRSGLTRLRNQILRNQTATKMSKNVIMKGIRSSIAGGIWMDSYYGAKQYGYDRIKRYLVQ